MKKNHHKLRLLILSAFAIAAYVFMVGNYFFQDLDDFKSGFNDGREKAKIENDKDKSFPEKSSNMYFLSLQPKNGFRSFPESIKNNKNSETINYRSHYIKTKVSFDKANIEIVRGYVIAEKILVFALLCFVIYIPIVFFRFIFSLMNQIVFNKRNIGILRRLGGTLVLFYITYFASNWCSLKISRHLFDFSQYKIVQNHDADFIWVLLGIVVLLFAEILSKGSVMQEEQELTI